MVSASAVIPATLPQVGSYATWHAVLAHARGAVGIVLRRALAASLDLLPPQVGSVGGAGLPEPLSLVAPDAGGTRRTPTRPGGSPSVPARPALSCRWRRPAAFPHGSAERGSAPSPEAGDPSRVAR